MYEEIKYENKKIKQIAFSHEDSISQTNQWVVN